MSTPLFRQTHGVVPACDVETLDELRRLIDATTAVEGIVGYKLGLTGVLQLGLAGVVRLVREHTDLPLVYDHQKAGPDIPDMGAKFARLCREAGVQGLILFPLAGPRAVQAFVGESLAQGLVPIVGGALPLPDYLASGGGFVADDGPERIFRQAAALGADHFVVPANESKAVRRYVGQLRERVARPSLIMPGIGSLGGTIGESFAEVKGCSAYAIVGRAIYGSPDPAEAARRLGGEALVFAAKG